MKHIKLYEGYINESKYKIADAFKATLQELSNSKSPIVKEVADLLLAQNDFFSDKFKKDFYIVDADDDTYVIFDNQKLKLGRFLSQVLPDVPLFKREQFATAYKFQKSSAPKFAYAELSGNDIDDGYDKGRYVKGETGDLNSSCMNNKFDYLELYKSNSNVVKLAVCLDSNDKVCARALVWTLDDDYDYYDRIYYRSTEHQMFLLQQFEKKNLMPVNSAAITRRVEIMEVPDHFPYVDSFKYINKADYETYLTREKTPDTYGILDQTWGDYTDISNDKGDLEHQVEETFENYPEEAIEWLLDSGMSGASIINNLANAKAHFQARRGYMIKHLSGEFSIDHFDKEWATELLLDYIEKNDLLHLFVDEFNIDADNWREEILYSDLYSIRQILDDEGVFDEFVEEFVDLNFGSKSAEAADYYEFIDYDYNFGNIYRIVIEGGAHLASIAAYTMSRMDEEDMEKYLETRRLGYRNR